MNSMRVVMLPMILIGILLSTAPCWGAPELILAGRGNGLYEVVGQGLEKVRTLELTLMYDPGTLTDPRIGQRGLIYGAMMIPDLSTPGVIRATVTSSKPEGIQGNGAIAMFTFSLMGAGPGSISSFTATLTSTAGTPIPLPQPRILADDKGRFIGNPFSRTSNPSQEPPGAITGTTGSERLAPPGEPPRMPVAASGRSGDSVTGPGGVGLPATAPGATGQARPLPPEAVEIPMAAADPVTPPVPNPGTKSPPTGDQSYRSILSRFKEYTGPLTVQALTALFARSATPGFRQDPPIVLSYGTARMTVYLTPQTTALQSPNFALTGATLVSLKLKGAEYVLELTPDAGVSEASVTMLSQGRFVEYPLVVAPPMNPGGSLDEATFAAFLQSHAEKKGKLNKNGPSDNLDLYCYTANYLVRSKGVDPVASVAPKAAVPVAVTPAVVPPVVPVVAALAPDTSITAIPSKKKAPSVNKVKKAKKAKKSKKPVKKTGAPPVE